MIIGAALGAIGSIVNQGIQIYRDKQQAEVDKEKRTDEYEMAKLKASSDVVVESYKQDEKAGEGVSDWVANIRSLIRPGITIYSLMLVTILYFCAGAADRGAIIAMLLECTSMCITWWFGDRFKRN